VSSLHKEVNLEDEICEYLAVRDWLYAVGDAAAYDRARALFPADVIAWLEATQPKAWDALIKNHGSQAADVVLGRLRDAINQRGTLDVLRHGIELLGLRQPLTLAQFKPALAMNPEILAKYAANGLRVVRQVRYSLHNENAIDLVLFLNGIPVATVELKTDFTQSVDDAVDQYRFDRDPHPKGQGASEPLLSFPNGALVHFAVSNMAVMMTTQLSGAGTKFLPFNRGDKGAAGNPPDEKGGHRTAYLWEEVWARDSWLEILGRYIVAQKDKKKQITKVIFPRYHQLDATRKLLAAVLAEGAGGKYLIQHSAGSGKTNSIAWSAHFLADLHNAQHQKLFDTVLVISDRTVLDSQLQDAVFDFSRTTGVVATIKGESASKSGELAEALAGGKKIVVCTIQTFPFALKAVHDLAATQGKRFAVIADEAHSSQTGEAAAKLKAVLSSEELQELADGGEVSTEDLLAVQMAARASEAGISYVAFTATPKAKTLELFGRRPNPQLSASTTNLPQPFHVYSMRQAIEEGFILDVLKNYTPYKMAFKLAHSDKELDDKEVERSEALRGIMRWVRLHPYNIVQKVQVVVEHFRETVARPRDKAEEYRAQARRLRERLEGYLGEHPDFTLKKMLLSGSLAKGTALRSLNDIDVACYISGADAPHEVSSLLNYLAERLRKAFPNSTSDQVKPQTYSVTVSFRGSGLDVDVVPILYKGDPQWCGDLVSQDDGSLLMTNIPLHIEFIRKRKRTQPDHFAQVVRLVKAWARRAKTEKEDFRFKSFMIELILSHLCDQGLDFSDYPEALQHFFTYVAKSNMREKIVFGDCYTPATVGTFSTPVQIIDPVNAKNNVSRLYTSVQADAIVDAALLAGDAIDAALRATTREKTVYYWRQVFGSSFEPEGI
jgi:SWI2/SNF2 ATPase/Type I restriction enzyme R protein N terminus (HSDR_N)